MPVLLSVLKVILVCYCVNFLQSSFLIIFFFHHPIIFMFIGLDLLFFLCWIIQQIFLVDKPSGSSEDNCRTLISKWEFTVIAMHKTESQDLYRQPNWKTWSFNRALIVLQTRKWQLLSTVSSSKKISRFLSLATDKCIAERTGLFFFE